jgi:hypothetical protein
VPAVFEAGKRHKLSLEKIDKEWLKNYITV